MNLGYAIYTILHSDSDVEGMVGTQITPDVVKRHSTLPAITYTLDSVTITETKDTTTNWDDVYISLTCFGLTRLQCEELSGYVRIALNRVTGRQGLDTVITSNYLGESWAYDDDDTRSESNEKGYGIYVTNMNFRIVVSDVSSYSPGGVTSTTGYILKDTATQTLTVGNNTLTHSKSTKLRTLIVSDSTNTNNYFPNWINTDTDTATIEWVGSTLTDAIIKYSY